MGLRVLNLIEDNNFQANAIIKFIMVAEKTLWEHNIHFQIGDERRNNQGIGCKKILFKRK